ncbi:MAG: hypothetical protein ACP5SH_07505 [Syntrophobacteraceae bacterium]
MASNKSCISLPSACAGFWEELVEEVEAEEEVEEELEPSKLELLLPDGGGPGGGDIEIPIWPSDSMTLCMSELSPESEPLSVS